MNYHLGILQQRVKTVAVGGDRAADQPERMRRKIDQQEEENLDRRNDRRGMKRQLRIDLVTHSQHQAVR